jgi:hypothetical protein
MKFNNLNKNVKSMLSNEYHYCISMGFEKKIGKQFMNQNQIQLVFGKTQISRA